MRYEYEILQQDIHGKEKEREDVLKRIEESYGDPTKKLYNNLPAYGGRRSAGVDDLVAVVKIPAYGPEKLNDDYVITLFSYDK